jgi:hypothetical protein
LLTLPAMIFFNFSENHSTENSLYFALSKPTLGNLRAAFDNCG